MMLSVAVDQRAYRQIFLAERGPGPWPCHYEPCDELVQPDELEVHHIDENHSNHDPANLTAIHHGCHARLHQTGRPKTEEHRRRLGDANRGNRLPPRTDEHKRKLLESNLGRKRSAQARANMRAAQQTRRQGERQCQ